MTVASARTARLAREASTPVFTTSTGVKNPLIVKAERQRDAAQPADVRREVVRVPLVVRSERRQRFPEVRPAQARDRHRVGGQRIELQLQEIGQICSQGGVVPCARLNCPLAQGSCLQAGVPGALLGGARVGGNSAAADALHSVNSWDDDSDRGALRPLGCLGHLLASSVRRGRYAA